MPVEIDPEGAVAAAEPAVPGSSAAPAPAGDGVPEPTTLRIEGQDRECFRVAVAGKAIVYTERLSVLERRALARAQKPEDAFAPEAAGFNQAAARVRMIDGIPTPFPSNDSQIIRILEMLGDEAAEWLYERGAHDYQERVKAKAKN